MKKSNTPHIRACLLAFALLLTIYAHSQPAQQVYSRVLYSKVDLVNLPAYTKIMKEQVKPALQQAKQSGSIAGWYFFSVGFTGTESEYNFVSVLVYDSWAKTERLPSLEELIKKANPKADAASITKEFNTIRKMVKQEFYVREDAVEGPQNAVSKYIMINYMKSSPGNEAAYIKDEKEVWKPIHQEFVKSGQTSGWSFWGLIMPSGTQQDFDYVTVNDYQDYTKINSVNYQEAAKKVHPTKTPESIFEQTAKGRSIVRAELWELVEYIE